MHCVIGSDLGEFTYLWLRNVHNIFYNLRPGPHEKQLAENQLV